MSKYIKNAEKVLREFEGNQNSDSWKSLQSFYRFKSMLLPDFVKRNARNLGSIEAELIREYEKGGAK